jgi:hypothetical protein
MALCFQNTRRTSLSHILRGKATRGKNSRRIRRFRISTRRLRARVDFDSIPHGGTSPATETADYEEFRATETEEECEVTSILGHGAPHTRMGLAGIVPVSGQVMISNLPLYDPEGRSPKGSPWLSPSPCRDTDHPVSVRQSSSVQGKCSFFGWRSLHEAKGSAQWRDLLITLTGEERQYSRAVACSGIISAIFSWRPHT